MWGGWTIDNSIVMMHDEAQPDIFTATVNLKANGEFKFLTETWWGALEYRAGDTNLTLTDGGTAALVSSDDNGNDCKFTVGETANYDIVCDLVAKTIVVKKAKYQTNPLKHTALWMVGSATSGGWSIGEGTMLVPTVDNPTVFKATVNLVEGEMKIAVNNQTGFGQNFYQRDAADDAKMVFGGADNKWNITKEGQYDVEADVKNLTISIKEHTSTGINNMETTATATAEYFTLSGVRLSAPAKGICVKRMGNKVIKIINKK